MKESFDYFNQMKEHIQESAQIKIRYHWLKYFQRKNPKIQIIFEPHHEDPIKSTTKSQTLKPTVFL